MFKGHEDGAGPRAFGLTAIGEPAERGPRRLKLRNPTVERRDACLRHLPRTRAVVGGIEREQFPDLLQREARSLCGPYEPEPAKIVRVVPTYPAS